MKNLGTYFEIPVSDLDRATKFYSFVFECEFSREVIHGNEMAFFPFVEGKPGITGALAKGEIYKPSLSGALIYLDTSDLNKSLERVTEKGCEVLFPKTPVAGIGFVAEFKDCEGNRIALFQQLKSIP
jgi:predicted enzyme related to lactoylglutathione lyase